MPLQLYLPILRIVLKLSEPCYVPKLSSIVPRSRCTILVLVNVTIACYSTLDTTAFAIASSFEITIRVSLSLYNESYTC